jgi:hypothetical protein
MQSYTLRYPVSYTLGDRNGVIETVQLRRLTGGDMRVIDQFDGKPMALTLELIDRLVVTDIPMKRQARARLKAWEADRSPVPRPVPGAARPAPGNEGAGGRQRTGQTGQPVDGKVKVSLEVKSAPGLRVLTRGLDSSDRRFPVEVKTGRAMAAPA